MSQIIRRIGQRLNPTQCCVRRKRNPRHIAIIGARFERFGAASGQNKIGLSGQGHQIAQTLCPQGLDGQHQKPVVRVQNNRHSHTQIRARTGQEFGDVRRKRHEGDGLPAGRIATKAPD